MGHPVADTERYQVGFQFLDTLVALFFKIYLWESANEKILGPDLMFVSNPTAWLIFLGMFKAGLISLSSLSSRQVKLTLLLSWATGLHHPPIWFVASSKQTTHLLANSYCSICSDPTFWICDRTDVWVWFVFSSNPTSRYFLSVAFRKCRTAIFNIFSYFYFHSNKFCFREHDVILVSAAPLSWFVTFSYVVTALLLKSRFRGCIKTHSAQQIPLRISGKEIYEMKTSACTRWNA